MSETYYAVQVIDMSTPEETVMAINEAENPVELAEIVEALAILDDPSKSRRTKVEITEMTRPDSDLSEDEENQLERWLGES